MPLERVIERTIPRLLFLLSSVLMACPQCNSKPDCHDRDMTLREEGRAGDLKRPRSPESKRAGDGSAPPEKKSKLEGI